MSLMLNDVLPVTFSGDWKISPPSKWPVVPSHYHCPDCHLGDCYDVGGLRVCSRCKDPRQMMLMCTPMICGSS